jgi:hypothetical protein
VDKKTQGEREIILPLMVSVRRPIILSLSKDNEGECIEPMLP